jgi:exosortase/archaeosortase family protein
MIYDKKSRKKLLKILLFIIKLDAFLVPLFFLLQADFSYEPLQNFLTAAVSNTLNFLGYTTTLSSHYISTAFGKSMAVIDISMDCTGWKSAYVLFALAIATPLAFKKKLGFLLASIPIIFFINYIRIVSTVVFAQQFGLQYLDIIHSLLWQEGLVIAVLAMWMLWIWSNKRRNKAINLLGRKYKI